MKIKFDRKSIQKNSVLIAYFLILFMVAAGIFSIADTLLHWNIFPYAIERYLLILLWASVLIVIAAFLINVMVSINIISESIEQIADNTKMYRDEE
jgi:hypothetical protein